MALFNKRISYEVLIGEDSRWLLDTTQDQKSVALTRAQYLLDSNQHDAIKVIRLENDENEEIIFLQECENKIEKPITISAIDESAVCNVADDLCAFAARKTCGRLLRQCLDEWGITALELLHNYGHIRQLARMESLYDQALHRAASIQARSLGEEAAKRNDALYKLAEEVEKRAHKVDDIAPYLAILDEKGLAAALAEINNQISTKKARFFTGAVLAQFLGRKRDWKAKLGLVVGLLENETDAHAIDLLDQACAEILDGSEAVKDLLGPQPDLVSALLIMIRLSRGTYDKGASDTPLGRFNAVMKSKTMPYSRDILLERVARAVSGTNPLTRESDESDKQAFLRLFKELISLGGFIGGVAISEAVTRRTRIVMKSGDTDLSPDAGIDSVLTLLPNTAVKIGYLLDLSHSEFGAQYLVGVLKPLMRTLESVSDLKDLLAPGSSPDEIVMAVEDVRPRIGTGAAGQEIGALIDAKLKKLLQQQEPKPDAAPPSPAPPIPKKPPKGELGQRMFKAGETIFNEGEAGDEAYTIVSGEVEITIKSGERVITLATLDRGQILGEMALVDNQPRMATAKAIAETTLTVIPQEAFKKRLDWLAGEDRLISHLLEIFVDRLRKQASNL